MQLMLMQWETGWSTGTALWRNTFEDGFQMSPLNKAARNLSKRWVYSEFSGARTHWSDQIKEQHVVHTWSDLDNISLFYFLTYLLFISEFTYSNVLHFDSNKSLDISNSVPEENNKMFAVYIVLSVVLPQLSNFPARTRLPNYYQIGVLHRHAHIQPQRYGAKMKVCLRSNSHNAQSSGVISRCVHTLISIQSRWANSLGGSQPASDLHNILHSHRDTLTQRVHAQIL